jgi:hypothetical protein
LLGLYETNTIGYYWPLLPLSVFVVYAFAFLAGVTKRSGLSRLLHICGVVYLAGYIAISLASIVLLFVPGEHGSRQRAKLMGGSDLHHGPSMAMTYEFSPARQFVLERLQEHPNTLLLTSRAHWFFADPTVDRARLYSLSCSKLAAQYLSGPARMVLLAHDTGDPQELWENVSQRWRERGDCFERLPPRHLLQRFPEEGLMVLETHVPAGMRVMLAQ